VLAPIGKKDIKVEHRKEALKELLPFYYEYLDGIMEDGVYLVSGNRGDIKGLGDMIDWLLAFDDGIERAWGEKKGYRVLIKRISTMLRTRLGQHQRLEREFLNFLKQELVRYHWILPYPSKVTLTQTTKERQRMWFSIITASRRPLEAVPSHNWKWAKKDHRPGYPDELPTFLVWDRDRWETWVKTTVRRASRTEEKMGPFERAVVRRQEEARERRGPASR